MTSGWGNGSTRAWRKTRAAWRMDSMGKQEPPGRIPAMTHP
jgi:hypothetical protein